MRAEMGRDRVKGFLDAAGKRIVKGEGQEIMLTGWGIGNCLLCEGYMWKGMSSGSSVLIVGGNVLC